MAVAWTLGMVLAGAACGADAGAGVEEASELVTMINAHREAAAPCEGGPAGTRTALGADDRLARLGMDGARDPLGSARAAGYPPAKVQVIQLSGLDDPDSAMRFLLERYCNVLRDEGFVDIGVARDIQGWQVVLARPLIDAELAQWREAGKELVEQINQARAESRLCGSARHEAAPPLLWNDQLAKAAHAHASDMAARDYFDHISRNGMTLADRVDETDYPWARVGENIAAGSGSPAQAVAGWLDSPGHCATLMNPDFVETAAAYATDEDSEHMIYWVQVFATRR